MKSGRFIINSDYCTTRISSEDTISITIPDRFEAGPNSPTVFRSSKVIGKKGESYRAYLTTNRFNYATGLPCPMEIDGAQGLNGIDFLLDRNGNTFTLRVVAGTQASSDTYIGYGQTVTAHIQTLVSPFQQ